VARLPDTATLRASEIIGEARQNRDPEYLRTLPSDEILQSQELLVRGFAARIVLVNQRLILLDAHSVIDSGSGYVDMPMEVFGRLGADAFIHVEDDPIAIRDRRLRDSTKRRPVRTVAQLSEYQARSVKVCTEIAGGLSKRVYRIKSGDVVELERAVRLVMANYQSLTPEH
jgi:adenylate kinase